MPVTISDLVPVAMRQCVDELQHMQERSIASWLVACHGKLH